MRPECRKRNPVSVASARRTRWPAQCSLEPRKRDGAEMRSAALDTCCVQRHDSLMIASGEAEIEKNDSRPAALQGKDS